MDETVELVLTNAPDADTARRIARALVEQRLAACVNVGAPVWSVYRWQGDVESADEVPLCIKSTRGRRAEVIEAVARLHPYDVPEILVVPVAGGSVDYLAWAAGQVRPPSDPTQP